MNRYRGIQHSDDDREPRDSRLTRRDGHFFDPMHQWAPDRKRAYVHGQQYQADTDRQNRAFGQGQTAADRFDEVAG